MFDKNFKIKVSGNWCEYQPNKHIDLREIISFECWADQLGNPYRFHLKNGSYHYIERYEIGKQIENVLKEQQAKVEELEGKLKQAYEDVDTFATAHEALEQRVDRDRSLIQFTQRANKDLIAERDSLKNQLSLQLQRVKAFEEELTSSRNYGDELQKRVDQQGLIIAKAMSIASDLQKSWSMFEIGKKLEQAIKGEGK